MDRKITAAGALCAATAFALTACGGGIGSTSTTSAGASSGSTSSASVPQIPGLPTSAVDIMNSPPYANSTWAIKVTDAASGEALVDYNASALVEPASVTKTFSVGAGWLKFGPDSRITTPVVHTGTVDAGTLTGDLVLVAKGDILMGGQTGSDGRVVFTDLDHNDANDIPGATIADNNPLAGLDALAAQVKAAGISTVSGQVVIDDRLFTTQDLGHNGPVSPIVINNNLVDVVSTPGAAAGQPVTTSKVRPQLSTWQVDNQVVTAAAGAEPKVEVTSEKPGVITLRGSIPADGGPVVSVYAMPDPATFARTAFVEALLRAGVAVAASPADVNAAAAAGLPAESAVAQLPQVASLAGLSYEQNATYILKVSYNRGAQTQICLLAVAAGSKDCDAGLAQLATILPQVSVDPKQVALVDGSGLPGNYITPTASAQLMAGFNARPEAARWQSTLPTMGKDGSIATVQRDSPAAGHVFAKTGTLGAADLVNDRLRLETKALGGYIDAQSGRRLAVSIIVNQAMFDDIQGVFAANEDLGKIATAIYEKY